MKLPPAATSVHGPGRRTVLRGLGGTAALGSRHPAARRMQRQRLGVVRPEHGPPRLRPFLEVPRWQTGGHPASASGPPATARCVGRAVSHQHTRPMIR